VSRWWRGENVSKRAVLTSWPNSASARADFRWGVFVAILCGCANESTDLNRPAVAVLEACDRRADRDDCLSDAAVNLLLVDEVRGDELLSTRLTPREYDAIWLRLFGLRYCSDACWHLQMRESMSNSRCRVRMAPWRVSQHGHGCRSHDPP
jgi:hypothetical protein